MDFSLFSQDILIRYCDDRNVSELKEEPARPKSKKAKPAAKFHSHCDQSRLHELAQISLLRMEDDEILHAMYQMQLSVIKCCSPAPSLIFLAPFLDGLLKEQGRIARLDDCLKAFHEWSSNTQIVQMLQQSLCNASSDFVAWFLLTFMHVFAEEFADKNKLQTEIASGVSTPKVNSKDEKDVVFYIAGSVISKLLKRMHRLLQTKKAKNSSDTQKLTEDITRLNRLVDQGASPAGNATLTNALNRGGLKFPKTSVFRIFCRAEQLFCSKVGKDTCAIDIATIVEECINERETRKNFFAAIEEPQAENSLSVLRACIQLYFKIRAHGYAKYLAERYRKATQTLKKKKGIRSELKGKDNKSE